MDVDVRAVPLREHGMAPFEVMTSESQERMLAIVEPDGLDTVLEICSRWEVRANVIGRVTEPPPDDPRGGRLRILDGWEGEVLADVPAASLHDDAPLYDREQCPVAGFDLTERVAPPTGPMPDCDDPAADLLGMLGDTAWVYRQYDHQLFLNTVVAPGADASLLRLKHPVTGSDTGRALGLTTDGNHAWCAVDPRRGTALVVAEAVLNLACVGARPLALVNCLNFGNPEHPEVMWQLAEAVDGMAEACRAFDIPVVGGNVSLYNESRGADIDPTPVVGLLGMTDDLEHRPPGTALVDGGRLLVLGPPPQRELSGTRWARDHGHRGGRLPLLDTAAHLEVADVVRRLVAAGLLAGVHDVAEGGLGAALAEMAAASGVGVSVARVADHVDLFDESPSRVVLCVAPERVAPVENVCAAAEVEVARVGVAGGGRFTVKDLIDLPLDEVADAWRGRLVDALDHGTVQG